MPHATTQIQVIKTQARGAKVVWLWWQQTRSSATQRGRGNEVIKDIQGVVYLRLNTRRTKR
jgi:hypothetical protein